MELTFNEAFTKKLAKKLSTIDHRELAKRMVDKISRYGSDEVDIPIECVKPLIACYKISYLFDTVVSEHGWNTF